MNSQKILRKQEVLRRIGVSASTLWRMVRDGWFPRPVRISANRVGWLEAEIDEWICLRLEKRDHSEIVAAGDSQNSSGSARGYIGDEGGDR